MSKLFFSILGFVSLSFFGYCILVDANTVSPNINVDKIKVQKVYDTVKTIVSEKVNQGGGGYQKDYSPEAKSYFNEIVMNNEFTGPRKTAYKWTTNMNIYVEGDKRDYLMSELRDIVSELNSIINTIEIKFVTSRDQANYFVYFGSDYGYVNRYKLISPERVKDNWGYFEVYAKSGNMYVDIFRANTEEQKHLLREELTQSLGLFNDSWKYPESIFYQGWTTTTEYAPIDRELIDMLYNN